MSQVRLGREAHQTDPEADRSAYQRDYDRILFSGPFRRLQNKTQVLPLPKAEFVHTRLTHTLETSAVGRSLGMQAGRLLTSNSREDGVPAPEAWGQLVGAGCLAHDLGNPPFGHFGEEAIGAFFVQKKKADQLRTLNEAQLQDLIQYEGNAAGFHQLTHHAPQISSLQGGLQLTAACLATFAKYPKPSVPQRPDSGRASQKKFGYFQADRAAMEAVARSTGMEVKMESSYGAVYLRHPLAFLVEAADDICYNIIDLEDAFQSGWVSRAEVETYLGPLAEKAQNRPSYSKIHDPGEKMGYLRAHAINRLVDACAQVFAEQHTAILEGRFDQALVQSVPQAAVLRDLKKFSVARIYRAEPILELELSGYRIIHGLLEALWQALQDPEQVYFRKMLALLPPPFRHLPQLDGYPRCLQLALYMGGLSDHEAIQLYQKING